nr:hypothetical protein [Candidatus Delongbacteria bacterium]
MIKAILFFMLISISIYAQTSNKYDVMEKGADLQFAKNSKQDDFYQNRVHRAGEFWMNITNFGVFGNALSYTDPCTGKVAISGDMPGGEGIQYFYNGSLWFGGYLDSAVVNVNGTAASIFQGPLVSTGFSYDPWYYGNYELIPGMFDEDPSGLILGNLNETSNVEGRINCMFEDVYDPAATAEEQFSTMYTDKGYTPNHTPLGIEVRQKSYSWSYKFAEKFIIVDYTLYNRNTDQKDIYDFFMGIDVDNDIGVKSAVGFYSDDICGFIQQWDGYIDPATGENKPVDLNFAWAADNDGREQIRIGGGDDVILLEPEAGRPLDGATGVSTLRVLRNPNPNLKYSFNIYSWSWGPRWKPGLHSDWEYDLSPKQKGYDDVNYDSLYVGGEFLFNGRTRGYPVGDIGRYMVMSNFEYDYGITDMREVYKGVFEDPPSLIGTSFAQADKWQPWIVSGLEEPDQIADGTIKVLNNIANGVEVRYVLSFGPLGSENYVNVAFNSDHNYYGTMDDFINKKVWKFAYGDSIKLTLAF